jgi:hypothetical protein
VDRASGARARLEMRVPETKSRRSGLFPLSVLGMPVLSSGASLGRHRTAPRRKTLLFRSRRTIPAD